MYPGAGEWGESDGNEKGREDPLRGHSWMRKHSQELCWKQEMNIFQTGYISPGNLRVYYNHLVEFPCKALALREIPGCSQHMQLLQKETHRLDKCRARMAGPALHPSRASPDWRALLQNRSSAWKRGLEESSGKERKPLFLGDRQL